jgi:hypothetical protein
MSKPVQTKARLRTDLRQINPVVDETGSITIGFLALSLRAKRSNRGPLAPRSESSRPGLLRCFAPRNDERRKRKRNAVRRCSVTSAALRAAALPHPHGRGSTSSGVPPRLLPKGVVVPKAQLGPGFLEYVHQTKRTCRLCRTQLQRAPRTPVIVPAG